MELVRENDLAISPVYFEIWKDESEKLAELVDQPYRARLMSQAPLLLQVALDVVEAQGPCPYCGKIRPHHSAECLLVIILRRIGP